MPAQAGIQFIVAEDSIPAFAGMTFSPYRSFRLTIIIASSSACS